MELCWNDLVSVADHPPIVPWAFALIIGMASNDSMGSIVTLNQALSEASKFVMTLVDPIMLNNKVHSVSSLIRKSEVFVLLCLPFRQDCGMHSLHGLP